MSDVSFSETKNADTPTAAFQPLTFEIERYQAMLDGSDMTEAEKRDLLEALWSIVVGFVDLGFRVHPIQQVPDAPECLSGLLASTFGDVLSSDADTPENRTSKTVDHPDDDRAAKRES